MDAASSMPAIPSADPSAAVRESNPNTAVAAMQTLPLPPLPRLAPPELDSLYLHCTLPARVPHTDTGDTAAADVALLTHTSAAIRSLHSQWPAHSAAASAYHRALRACDAWSQTLFSGALHAEHLHTALHSLQPGDSLPIHLHAHNASILITRAVPEGAPWCVCAFVIAMPAAPTTRGRHRLTADFPAAAARVESIELLLSRALCEKLVQLDRSVLEVAASHSRKAGTDNKEIREVAEPWPITEWLTTLLACDSAGSSSSPDCDSLPFVKKLRDVVSYKRALKPWRRSAQWMAIKASVQWILQRECPPFGLTLYKTLLLHQLSMLARSCAAETGAAASKSDALQSMVVKIARRMDKLQQRISGTEEAQQTHVRTVLLQAKAAIEEVSAVIAARWHAAQQLLSTDVALTTTAAEFEAATRHEKLRCTAAIEAALTGEPTRTAADPDALPNSSARNLTSMSASILRGATCETSRGLALGDAEQWISHHLPSWDSKDVSADNKCAELFGVLEAYHTTALKHYPPPSDCTLLPPSDPLGYSRTIIARLQLLRVIDRVCCTAHPLLLRYRSGVDLAVLDHLLLPLQSQMIEVASLRDYFCGRDRSGVDGPSLMESSAFAAQFAQQSADMDKTHCAIRCWAGEQWEAKRRELGGARQRHEAYLQAARSSRAQGCWCAYRRTCANCKSANWSVRDASNMRVDVFEEPLPRDITDQWIVIFELCMPQCLRLLRESLQLFCARMRADSRSASNGNDYPWLQSSQLQQWLLRPASSRNRVWLISDTKPVMASHYRSHHPTEAESVFHPNQGRTVVQFNGLSASAQSKEWKQETQQCLAFNLDPAYSALQFALHFTSHTQNQVLAIQSECSQSLSLEEFVALGSLRANHALQWHHLLSLIVMRTPTFQSDDVARFVAQAIWQMGPAANARMDAEWLTESHVSGADPAFAVELVGHLQKWLQRIEGSWLNGTSLYVIIIIAMRLHALNAGIAVTRPVLGLIRRCRLAAVQWMCAVQEAIQAAARQDHPKLMAQLCRVACFAAITFACDQ